VLVAAVLPASRQELLLRARGADALRFDPRDPKDAPDLDAYIRDPVVIFARAAGLGLLDGAAGEGGGRQPGAAITGTDVDAAASARSWRLRVRDLDPGALRVLGCLLLACDLDAIEMTTIAAEDAAGRDPVDPLLLPFPEPPARPPFRIEIEQPLRSSRDRFVQIGFAAPPSEALVAEVYAAIGVWAELLMTGGYPHPRRTPRTSGALPDPAFLLDERTIEQAFPEVFFCDEASFSAVIAYACRLHARGALIERVKIC
jgi:hypothetical protein